MIRAQTNALDPQTIALQALAWTLEDDIRASRLLALTGLDAGSLRDALSDPATLDGVLGFLEAHQPDLVACADALGIKPEDLINVRERLNA